MLQHGGTSAAGVSGFFSSSRCAILGIMTHLRFLQLRTPPLLRVHISDDGLCSLIDVHMLDPDVLVATVT